MTDEPTHGFMLDHRVVYDHFADRYVHEYRWRCTCGVRRTAWSQKGVTRMEMAWRQHRGRGHVGRNIFRASE